MTQYISSFLIDPVVRQARRFSRPGHDVDFVSDNHLDAVGEQSSPSHTGTRALPEEGHGMTSLNDTDSQLYVHPIYSQAIRPNEQVRMNVEHNGYGNEVARPLPEEPTRARAGTDPSRRASVTSNAHQISHSRFGSVNASFPSSIHDTSHRFAEGSELRRRGTDQSNISQMSVDSNHTTLASGLLPENDGMGVMRQKIRRIQNLDASNAEKSRLMHAVMMEQYSSSHMNFHTSQGLRPLSPASLRSQERPFTPSSSHSFQEHGASGSPLTSLSSAPDTEHYLTPDDLKITYYTHSHQTLDPESKPTDLPPNPTQTAALDDSGKPVLGCEHYKRNVKLQCSACYRWYTCRFCHDTVEDHSLNRRETKNMLCMPCGTAQPAAEICRNCGEISAWYYCGICKLWDNDPTKRIYHCDDCGICRIGEGLGKDYYHCKVFDNRPNVELLSNMLDVRCVLEYLNQRYSPLYRKIH